MSQFTTPLIVKFIDEQSWELVEPFEYHVDTYPSKEIIAVPEGFVTDFASIPKIFWSLVSPFGKYGKAAVIHDWLYGNENCLGYTREEADLIFLQAMKVLKVSGWKRQLIYQAVHYFGNKAWDKAREI